ncbi:MULTISPECIES: LysR family transcriptional regulator [unclassified Roseovarius]|uniref:LysR family transcriptional regulator n=1 Tax=unclassified Roseovarius TaxID=2614913 RepID=UPI00273D2197|nr:MULTISPECIES: LysR family transcriptional regulator [unclassified Roseovarius]
MDRDYSLKDLKALNVLLSERHVSHAAERLGMSQPAMSMLLKRLRTVFDDPLLVRNGNSHSLTDAAEDLRPRICDMIKDLEDLLEHGSQFRPDRSDRSFTLILTDYIDAILVPGLHRRFQQIAPGIELKIVGPDPFRLGRAFGEGRVDLTVSYFPNPPTDLVTRSVLTDHMVCVTRKGHPALASAINLEIFCKLDHVVIEPGQASMYRAVLDEALAREGFARRVAVSKPDFLGVPFLLEESDLVAAMPEKLAALFIQRFDLLTFQPPIHLPKLDIRMMWNRSTHRSAAHVWLREQILEICKQLNNEGETAST